jgi:prevent-host-death family protein
MAEVTVSEARARLADVVDQTRVAHDPVFLTRWGGRVAAVIDADDLQRLIEAAEDLADVEAAKAARAEMASGEAAIPWDEVKADLGLSRPTESSSPRRPLASYASSTHRPVGACRPRSNSSRITRDRQGPEAWSAARVNGEYGQATTGSSMRSTTRSCSSSWSPSGTVARPTNDARPTREAATRVLAPAAAGEDLDRILSS